MKLLRHLFNVGALLSASVFILRSSSAWDTIYGFLVLHFFIHSKSLLPGCEAFHRNLLFAQDWSTFANCIPCSCFCLLCHAQEAVLFYWIRAACFCGLVIHCWRMYWWHPPPFVLWVFCLHACFANSN